MPALSSIAGAALASAAACSHKAFLGRALSIRRGIVALFSEIEIESSSFKFPITFNAIE